MCKGVVQARGEVRTSSLGQSSSYDNLSPAGLCSVFAAGTLSVFLPALVNDSTTQTDRHQVFFRGSLGIAAQLRPETSRTCRGVLGAPADYPPSWYGEGGKGGGCGEGGVSGPHPSAARRGLYGLLLFRRFFLHTGIRCVTAFALFLSFCQRDPDEQHLERTGFRTFAFAILGSLPSSFPVIAPGEEYRERLLTVRRGGRAVGRVGDGRDWRLGSRSGPHPSTRRRGLCSFLLFRHLSH